MFDYLALNNLDVDCESGITRCMGDKALYESVFLLFANNTGRIDELYRTYNAGDYDALYGAAHDIKGVSANLGITQLFAMSSAVLAYIKNNEYEKLSDAIDGLSHKFSEISAAVL